MSRILGISGGTKPDSHTKCLVEQVLAAAATAGAKTHFVDLQARPFPFLGADGDSENPNVLEAKEKVMWSDGIILGTPDYHGSMSGVMKNFLDHFYKELAGRLYGYVCASHEKGLTAMDHMRTSVRQCYGWSLPYGIGSHPEDDIDAAGKISNVHVEKRLTMMGYDITRYSDLIHGQFEKDLKNVGLPGFSAHYR